MGVTLMKDWVALLLVIIGISSMASAIYWGSRIDNKYPTENRRLSLRYIDGHVDTLLFKVSKGSDFRLYSSRGAYHLVVDRKANIGWNETIVQHGVITFKEIR